MSNSDNTTGLMSGGMESWKMMSALFQMMMCIGANGSILPNRQYARAVGDVTGIREDCMLDFSDVVLSAAASCLEMYLAITSKVLRVGDIPTVQYLVDCAVFHHVRLSRLFKSLQMSTTEKKKKKSSNRKHLCLVPWDQAIGGNKCHLLRQHVVECKLWMGANPRQIDTELSEGFHKETVKKVFLQSSKRHDQRQFEMATVLSRKRVVAHLLKTVDLSQVTGKRNRNSVIRGQEAAPTPLSTRSYLFASESTPFARFHWLTPDEDVDMTSPDPVGQDLYLSEEDRICFFHPCISEEILHNNVSSFYANHHSLPNMRDVEVFAIQSVKIADAGKAEWMVLCKPAKVMSEDDYYDEREQSFSAAFCNIDDIETFVRIFGIVLFTGMEEQDDGQWMTANYYTVFVQPLEQREGGQSAKTYLPFPVMYPEFGDRDEEGSGRRDERTFVYLYSDMDGLLGPSAVIRMPKLFGGDAGGQLLESESMFSNHDSVPPFLVIDLRRFDWPKDASWDSSSYATDLVAHPNAVQREIELYPSPVTLSEMQVAFGLEDEGPDADVDDDVVDSLDAVQFHGPYEEDRETFDFLLADLEED